MEGAIFIDGDFDSGKGDCKYHCSPTCHSAQVGPDWKYGCRFPAHPFNKMGDFVPIVECNGIKAKCEMVKEKFFKSYRRGLIQRINNAKKKIEKWESLIKEMDDLKNESES